MKTIHVTFGELARLVAPIVPTFIYILGGGRRTARRASVPAALAVVCVLAASPFAKAQSADVVLIWNEIAQQTVAPANPLAQSRSMAIVHLAVLDALEAARADGRASPEAAVIAAAHAILTALHPDSASALDEALAAGLDEIADGAAKVGGIDIGRAAAEARLAERQNDGWNAAVPYEPQGLPGTWAPTPPAFAAAAAPQWGLIVPFVLERGDQFRPGPPSAIDTQAYLADLREVFEAGGDTGGPRTAEMSDVARFWVMSAVQGWNPVARQVSGGARSLFDNALTLAMLNVAVADALIACFDAKYEYDLWRPVTAIQAGLLGHAPEWTPFIVTPAFPAYPSAHACAAGAVATVLSYTYGEGDQDIVLTSPTAPGVIFRYSSFEEIADQIDDARVFGGIHTREDQVVGRLLGVQVGQYVVEAMAQAAQ